MIEYQLLIKETDNGSIAVQRRSKPTLASPREIAAAEHLKSELDAMIRRMMQAAGGGTSIRSGPAQLLSVRSQWSDYVATVFTKTISEAQHVECQKAFYAGAFAMLNMVGNVSSEFDEDTGCAYLEQLNDELQLFYQSMK